VSPFSGDLEADAFSDLEHLRRSCGCTLFELTDREAEVLEQLAEGKSTRTAARSLYVSDQAVTYHVGNLLAKFQCTNRTGLVARAFVLCILDRSWPPRVASRALGAKNGGEGCWHRTKDLQHRRTFT
jgi:DNA-binding CsgD family transcriptional regulator